MDNTRVSRRTVAKGMAWSVPAIAVSQAVPAFAASCKTPQTEVTTNIRNFLDKYTKTLPDLKGTKFRFWFYDAGGSNGSGLHEGGVMMKNIGQKRANFALNQLLFEFAWKQVDTSPAVNSVITRVAGPSNDAYVIKPYTPTGDVLNKSADKNQAPANAVFVNKCDATRRDASVGTSFANVYSQDGLYSKTTPAEVGEEKMICLPSTNNTAYGFLGGINTDFDPDVQKNIMALRPRDGGATETLPDGTRKPGRIYTAAGIRILGFVPPSYDTLRQAFQGNQSNEEFDGCYAATYRTLVEEWIKTTALRGASVVGRGWAADYIGGKNTTGLPARGGDKPIQVGEWFWSHEAGNFHGSADPKGVISEIGGPEWSLSQPGVVRASSLAAAPAELYYRDGIY